MLAGGVCEAVERGGVWVSRRARCVRCYFFGWFWWWGLERERDFGKLASRLENVSHVLISGFG